MVLKLFLQYVWVQFIQRDVSKDNNKQRIKHKIGMKLVMFKSKYLLERKEMFYLMTHSTHFIYGYMASDIW